MACNIRRIHFDLFLGIIGILLGFSAFATFIVPNYVAALLALYSGILAVIATLLHRACYKNTLHTISTGSFARAEIFGFVGFTLGCAFLLFFIFMMLHKHDIPVDEVVRSVWAFMTAKWGLILFFASKRYAVSCEHFAEITNRDDE